MAQATQVTLVVLVGITSLLVSVFLWDLLIVRKNGKTPALSFEGRMKNKSNITYCMCVMVGDSSLEKLAI